MLLPLALAQFICSYAASNMNVAINDIATDLNTTVQGVQLTITLFTLIMAAFMIPGSKLTDIWGRKKCFTLGLIIYGIGTFIAAFAPSLPILMIGYSVFEGIGTALLIPPVYILVTVAFSELNARARAFGIISAMAGVGAAAGPLIGGIITTALSWRAAFLFQTLAIVVILFLSRRVVDAGIKGPKPSFDFLGTILSAAGLVFVVIGILQANTYGFFVSKQDFSIGETVILEQGQISPVWLFVGIGALFLAWFIFHIRAREKKGKEPLLSIRLFKNKGSNIGLVTQNIQWQIVQGVSFVVSVFVQTVRGFSAIATGFILTPATIGILLSSMIAGKLAKKYSQQTLIKAGFLITTLGVTLLVILVSGSGSLWAFVPGLFLMGTGVGIMLTSSVNVVQSSFPEKDQGEISGLSRSISNLGSSLGTAIAGTIIVSAPTIGNQAYANALIYVIAISALGFVASIFLPSVKKSQLKAKSS